MLTRISRPGVALAMGVFAVCAALDAHAESKADTGAGALSAPAHIDFSIVIPRFLSFRVGTAGSTIDEITFTVPGGSVGSSTPVAGTGGDAGGGSAASVAVLGNGGQVTITPTNSGSGNGLQHATLNEWIDYAQITTSSSDAVNLNAPTLSNAGGTAVNPVLNVGNVTIRSAVWTYAYANTTVPSAGTYGTSGRGGRVTYTASIP